jgi:hypothetical protein
MTTTQEFYDDDITSGVLDDVEVPYPRWMEIDQFGNHPDDDGPRYDRHGVEA